MTGARRFGWLAALALVALALGACARDRNQVSVAIGTAPYQPAPSRAKVSAVARPMPLAAPVMTMVLAAK